MLGGQHPLNLVGDRAGDLLRPDREEESRRPAPTAPRPRRSRPARPRRSGKGTAPSAPTGRRGWPSPSRRPRGNGRRRRRTTTHAAPTGPRSACAMACCSCLAARIAAPVACRPPGPAGDWRRPAVFRPLVNRPGQAAEVPDSSYARSSAGETKLPQVTTFGNAGLDAPCILSDISAIFLQRREHWGTEYGGYEPPRCHGATEALQPAISRARRPGQGCRRRSARS